MSSNNDKSEKFPNAEWSNLLVVSFVFGIVGFDRFATGKWFTGGLKMSIFIVTCWFLADCISDSFWLILIPWWLIDFVLSLLGRFTDAEGNSIGRYTTREKYEMQIAEKERQIAEKQAKKQRKIKEKQHLANAEYKRQCRACGQIWHSSIEQENAGSGSLINTAVALMAASKGNLTAALLANNRGEEKEAARKNYLHSVRHCPHCGSSSYNEEIVSYI